MTEIATFAGGCFWCTEAVFKRVNGVSTVTSGYTGGNQENPSYEEISTGTTGHAEAIQLEFDPHLISYNSLLDIFFATHNPTTLNRQGADVGTQYRSAIFFHSQKQKLIAETKIKQLADSGKYPDPIVTQLIPFMNFYKAEAHHQNYYANNPLAPYCQIIIDPKIRKLMENYTDHVKTEYK